MAPPFQRECLPMVVKQGETFGNERLLFGCNRCIAATLWFDTVLPVDVGSDLCLDTDVCASSLSVDLGADFCICMIGGCCQFHFVLAPMLLHCEKFVFREILHSLRRNVEFCKVAVREQEVCEWRGASGGHKNHHGHVAASWGCEQTFGCRRMCCIAAPWVVGRLL